MAVRKVSKEEASYLAWSLGLLLNILAGGFLLFAAAFVAALKDGLGPDAVESHGAEAWRRWWEGMALVLPPILLVFLVGVLLCWVGKRLDLLQALPPATVEEKPRRARWRQLWR
jgi:hypothetical protein